MPSIRPLDVRRAIPAALVAGMLLSLLPAITIAADPPGALLGAEEAVLAKVNQFRAAQGLGALTMAEDVREVGRERSRSMKRLDYFGHVSPSGADAGDLLRWRGIAHRSWGEVIGWTAGMGLDEGVRWIVDWWKNSPVHRDLMLSRSFGYAGVGIAQEGSRVLWTIVFVNQADRTAPVARVRKPHRASTVEGATTTRTVVRWWGHDRQLASGRSRVDSFSVQHKVPGGRWQTVIERTTAHRAAWALRPGTHWFRVRARDGRGNVSTWLEATRIQVAGPRAS